MERVLEKAIFYCVLLQILEPALRTDEKCVFHPITRAHRFTKT